MISHSNCAMAPCSRAANDNDTASTVGCQLPPAGNSLEMRLYDFLTTENYITIMIFYDLLWLRLDNGPAKASLSSCVP